MGAGCCSALLAVWLSGWQGKTGREGESASEQKERTGVRGADEGGRQGRRAEPPEAPWWSRPDQSRPGSATVRTLSNVLVWSCPLSWCVNKTVLYVVVICEQRSNSGRAFGSSPDGLAAASSSRFSSRWPRRHFLLRPLSCGLAWGWTATPCLAPRESPQPVG